MKRYPLWIQEGVEEPEEKWFLWKESDPLTGDAILNIYGHNGWEPILTGGSTDNPIEEAPLDGNQYTRGSARWNMLDLSKYITVGSVYTKQEIDNLLLDKISISNLEQEIYDRTTADAVISNNISTHISNKSNPHAVTKAQIGLSNVDNTSDVNKPISTAAQNALGNKLDKATGSTLVYVVNANGNQTTAQYSSDNIPSVIVRRDADANIEINSNVTGNSAIGANQVDSKILTATSPISSQISGISTTLDQEISRSTSADTAHTQDIGSINTKINQNVVTNINYSVSPTGVNRSRTLKNLYTGAETTTSEAMPIVNNVNAGIVLPDVFNTITQNTQRISNLEETTAVELTNQPTKAALDSYVLPGNAKAGDIGVVQSDETQGGASTRYRLSGSPLTWVFDLRYGAPAPIATNTNLGTVLGDTGQGKVSIETDGTMSVNGWDTLKNSVPTAVSQLTNDANYTTTTQLDNKLDKVTGQTTRVYVVNASGSQTTIGYSSAPSTTVQTVPLRLADGNLPVLSSVAGNNAIGATQVDSKITTAIATKVDKTTTPLAVYGTSSTGTQMTIPYTSVTGLGSPALVLRGAGGNIGVLDNVSGNNAIGATQVDNKILAAVPVASTTNPVMDSTANIGSSTTYARADHRHPSDTSKVSTVTGNNRVYIVNASGSQTSMPYSASVVASSIPVRTASGDIAVNSNVTGNNAISAAQVDAKINAAIAQFLEGKILLVSTESDWQNDPRRLDNRYVFGLVD